MRFATGGGAEALAPSGYNGGGTCQNAWAAAGYSYANWKQHGQNILNAIAAQQTDKQIEMSVPYVSGGPTFYDSTNTFAATAAAKHIGLSFENLGTPTASLGNNNPGGPN